MSWDKLPALTTQEAGLRSGCLTCGPQPTLLNMDAIIAVGFGSAGITKDGIQVWSEGELWGSSESVDEVPEAKDAEALALALADPDHDWRIFYFGALSESEYQRHAAGQWVLVKKGDGFA